MACKCYIVLCAVVREGKKMRGRTIVKNSSYSNCYVATPTFNDNRVVAHGRSPSKVRTEAKEAGYKNPVVTFVPKENTINIL